MPFRWYCLPLLLVAHAHAISISVSSSGGNDTSPLEYGLMYEEINHSGDGGLYAELVRNRAFQGSTVYPSTLDGYEGVNDAVLSLKNLSVPLSSALPTSMNVKAGRTHGTVGFSNAGWWGIDVQRQKYTGSFYVSGSYSGKFTASLQSSISKETFASATIPARHAAHDGWTQYEFELFPKKAASNVNNTLIITFDAQHAKDGSLDFNLISLFPPTYKNRPNGLRIDLVEALAELGTKFLRFPGGSDIEGMTAPYWYNWEETVGPLKDRPGRPSAWTYEESDGLGLMDYMLLCDDLGLEPILAVWDGHYLSNEVIAEDQLEPYINSTLNQIEFLTGAVDTHFGAMRASLGHPAPWSIKYVEIGNEDNLYDGEASYLAYRFQAYYDAIKAKYPDIIVMGSMVGFGQYKGAADDYHQYTTPDGFVSQFNYFDQLDDNNRTLNGEVATVYPNNPTNSVAWGSPFPEYPFWIGSVAEAVFLIGEERNSPRIIGASYAPSFRNINGWQWSPCLISYSADPSQTSRSTSWHVIKLTVIQLLAQNHITHNLPTTATDGGYGPLYWVAGRDDTDGSHLFKVAAYNSTADTPVSLTFEGSSSHSATLTVLSAADPMASNVVDGPEVVETHKLALKAGHSGAFEFSLPSLSVAVLRTN
ncbi:alpha-L-arabinofuranosidase A [Penicillium riverlandense]|uniref:alpha-L-arabinofuranosidase A n=1 Tax=Penicillium riverlandense TaxID=1903569 RepID=UPI0025479F6E|nr:alpha-L-arabinofuranosidase A [Penicillium riverlandense]KAJ5815218.1 alpha-L-arabinofuranosidase A [Penicillium riverlandense]